ncbi:MAG: 2-nonaprenyl-3-methyl-6-methoxy-1,4-benzoquinol hydroxylase [Porticoccaceae bacterium]|nr:MAG: 2-nonaprenyl-3-methyl-6-methoxy-1,4-benzoquinol hydroxylase [Porticoccaceae bacterium]
MQPRLSLADRLIHHLDRGLRTLAGGAAGTRPPPAPAAAPPRPLDEAERRHAAGLMRVNHAGEVCAQALYQGQALTARDPALRTVLERAADEEIDHLAWCEERLRALGSRPSFLNPLWYLLSLGLGTAAGALGDRLSLGFLAATEELVSEHLERHLERLPAADTASAAVVAQMRAEEARHADAALAAGGLPFPPPVKALMRLAATVMTRTSYRL